MSVLTITKSNFNETVLKSDKPVLLDFWASWCGPCRMQAPIIDQLAAEHSNIVFGKVNVDEESDLASEYGITSIPTLIIFNNGQLINQVTGVTSKASLERMLGL
jgi:thioredoxin 1